MIRLDLTRHVVEGLGERRLERGWVERVATAAEWVEPSRARAGAMLAPVGSTKLAARCCRVTTIDDNEVRVVVTAHFDRRPTRAVRKTDADDL